MKILADEIENLRDVINQKEQEISNLKNNLHVNSYQVKKYIFLKYKIY